MPQYKSFVPVKSLMATAPFLFILVGILCEYAMVTRQLSEKSCALLAEGTDVCRHSAAHSSRTLKPMPSIVLLWQGHCWIGKNTNKEFNRVYGTYNLTKQYFNIPICFNECLWAIFSFGIKFWKFMVLYLGCGCMSFDFTTQMTLSHLVSYPCPWIKTSKSVLKCWERSVKRNSNRSFIRVIKNSSFDQHFLCICMVKTFLKIIWWRFLVPCSELLLVNSVYLSCKIRNISTLSMLLCHSTDSLFSEKYLTYAPAGVFSSLIKVLSVSEHNFLILKFRCFMLLLLNFVTSKYIFFRRII